jgi:hypothetical protein
MNTNKLKVEWGSLWMIVYLWKFNRNFQIIWLSKTIDGHQNQKENNLDLVFLIFRI